MPNSFPRSDSLPTDDVSFMLREIAEQADAVYEEGSAFSLHVRIDRLAKLIASLARTLALKEAADAGKAVA